MHYLRTIQTFALLQVAFGSIYHIVRIDGLQGSCGMNRKVAPNFIKTDNSYLSNGIW